MRMFALLALALASPVMAQDAIPDAAPDTADGYPLEAKYTDNSDNFPRDEMERKQKSRVLTDQDGKSTRTNTIVLTRGETVLFRVDNDGKATDIRKVDSKTQPSDGEIRAYMGGSGGNTTLLILNRSAMPYDYKAYILESPDAKSGQRTSVCTLLPNITAYEHWPDHFAAIAFGGFLPAPDGEMVCQ